MTPLLMRSRTMCHIVPHLREFICAIRGMRNTNILSTPDHLQLCAEWLLTCQRQSSDGGYSAFYSLITGWAKGYVETTGYIIPTMLDIANLLDTPQYRESALHAGKWLLKVQQQDGSYPDIGGYQAEIFDTGQVLFGLNRLFRETEDQRFLGAAIKAGDWLLNMQDADGSWPVIAHWQRKPRTYHVRVAAALIELGKIRNDERYIRAGEKNLRWAMSCQKENGYFLHCELKEGDDALLHAIIYVLEGFMMAYQLTGEQLWLEAVIKEAKILKEINIQRDVVLHSQYDENFHATNKEICITGLAQWAGLCLDLYAITKDQEFFEVAVLSIFYLKSKHLHCRGAIKGALPASVPLWGYYCPVAFVNWGVKFFADTLMKYYKYGMPVWKEQEFWVSACMKHEFDQGAWSANCKELEPVDELIIEHVEKILAPMEKKDVIFMDLGCGTGRYLQYFRSRYPQFRIIGVDPFYTDDTVPIINGSAYDIPYPDASVDVLFSYITLQHVSDIQRVLSEMKRVLKPNGVVVIGDRNLVSGRGLLKPYHELRGKWIYPWDSPFRERWYTKRRWRQMLETGGFTVQHIQIINNPGDRGLRRLMRMNSFLVIHAGHAV